MRPLTWALKELDPIDLHAFISHTIFHGQALEREKKQHVLGKRIQQYEWWQNKLSTN
jgi:hypothetical protein